MKLSNFDFYKALIKPLNIKVNEKFEIVGEFCNPYSINDEYSLIDRVGDIHPYDKLIKKEIQPISRFRNLDEMQNELKKLSGGYDPDWSDGNEKYFIIYSTKEKKLDIGSDRWYKRASMVVYFENKESAKTAIEYFTKFEWETYFGVKS